MKYASDFSTSLEFRADPRYPKGRVATYTEPERDPLTVIPSVEFLPHPGKLYSLDVWVVGRKLAVACPSPEVVLLPEELYPTTGQVFAVVTFHNVGDRLLAKHPETGARIAIAHDWAKAYGLPPEGKPVRVQLIPLRGRGMWLALPAEGRREVVVPASSELAIRQGEAEMHALLYVKVADGHQHITRILLGFVPDTSSEEDVQSIRRTEMLKYYPDDILVSIRQAEKDGADEERLRKLRALHASQLEATKIVNLAADQALEYIKRRDQQRKLEGATALADTTSGSPSEQDDAKDKASRARKATQEGGKLKTAPAAKCKKPAAPKPSKQTTKPAAAPAATAGAGGVTRDDTTGLSAPLGGALLAAGLVPAPSSE